MPSFTILPPLGLYIHFPWCVKKCPYCDFNSHASHGELAENAYVDALLKDVNIELPKVWGRKIQSIFMGGGTPSLFSPTAITRLIAELRACFNFNPAIEITLEANPRTVDAQRFQGYRQAGVNRLSIGVQSFDNTQLVKLGRIHNSQQALSAIQAAQAAGFDNLNLDLMFGLPEQTSLQMLDDLQQAIALRPAHLSHYQLTLEPNTYFASHPPALPDDDLLCDMSIQAKQLLSAKGYFNYEISAYTMNKKYCQHNLNYWQFGDYLGIGAGAHQKLTFPQGYVERSVKQKHPAQYLKQIEQGKHIMKQHTLTQDDLVFEFMLNTLRLSKGFSLNLFNEVTGLPHSRIQPLLHTAINNHWLKISNNRVQPTDLGMQFHNDVVALFLPDV